MRNATLACCAALVLGAAPAVAEPNGGLAPTFERALALAEAGETAAARALLEGIIRKHPRLVEPYRQLAVAAAESGDYAAAARALESALALEADREAVAAELTAVRAQFAASAAPTSRLGCVAMRSSWPRACGSGSATRRRCWLTSRT